MNMSAPNTGTPSAGEQDAPPPVGVPWQNAQGVYTVKVDGKDVPWWDSVPEEPVREFMKAKQYANPAVASVALYNLNKLQNGAPDVLALPGKDADAAAWDKFYAKLGRPEKPDGYDLKFGEGVQTHGATLAVGKEIFHMLGATPEKAQAAANKWNEFVAKQVQDQTEAIRVQNEQALAALQAQWGKDLDANKAAGHRVLQALKKDGLTDEDLSRVEAQIGSAAVVKMLAIIGKRSSEGTFSGGNAGGADPNDPSQMSKEQAMKRINELKGDATFVAKYQDKTHPQHGEAVKLMEALFARS